ncbi:Symplekin [Cucumispora dikerogammari]|nr:Symplekin [Cucumispora dikerogammari]
MKIFEEFKDIHNLTFTAQCSLFIRLLQQVNEESLIPIHAFLISLEVLEIELSQDKIPIISKLQQNVIDKILESTPFPNLKTNGLKLISKFETNKSLSIDNALRDYLIGIFNYMEKDHIIYEVESALEDSEIETFPFYEKIILESASCIKSVKPKHLITFIEPKHISKKLLIKLSEYPDFCNDFFMALYLHEKTKYDLFINRIFNLNYKLSPVIMNSLININFETIPVYSFEVFNYFITYQPKIKPIINEKCKTIKKTLLLNLITSHFEFFKDSCNDFNLTFNDLIFCAKNELNILYFLISDKTYLETFNYTTFLILLQNMEDDLLSEFFTKIIVDQKEQNINKRREVLENLFLMFIKEGKKISESIQSLLTSVFLDSKRYFLTLIDYIWKPIILTYQEAYLTDQKVLDAFLRQLSPIDILVQVHKYSDVKKAVDASKLCFYRTDIFNNEVLTQAILLLEYTFPILTLRTVLFTLINYPNTSNVICDFLIRTKGKIFEKEDNITGLIKCLNVLEIDKALEILLPLQFNQLKLLFRDMDLRYKIRKEIENKKNDKKYLELFTVLRLFK